MLLLFDRPVLIVLEGLIGLGSGRIFLVHSKHLGQSLISVVYILRVHLVKDVLVAIVAFLPDLCLKLVIVDRKVLASAANL